MAGKVDEATGTEFRVLNGRMDRPFALVLDIGLKSELPTASQL